ncbi:MAG: DUF1634 domain-containing protein [Acidobacteriaceae bacterium]|nr:DUF1634 domain-containing protein [Acidobacteriaceae bacterium]
MTEKRFDDVRMESIMGRLLRTGVFTAAAVVAAGGLLYLKHHAHSTTSYRTFSGDAALRHPQRLIADALAGDATALIQIGVLLLIATPIARVAFAVLGFALERDRLYVLISMFVLAALLYGLLFGS